MYVLRLCWSFYTVLHCFIGTFDSKKDIIVFHYKRKSLVVYSNMVAEKSSVTSVKRIWCPLMASTAVPKCSIHTYTQRQSTHTHKVKIEKLKKVICDSQLTPALNSLWMYKPSQHHSLFSVCDTVVLVWYLVYYSILHLFWQLSSHSGCMDVLRPGVGIPCSIQISFMFLYTHQLSETPSSFLGFKNISSYYFLISKAYKVIDFIMEISNVYFLTITPPHLCPAYSLLTPFYP